MVTLEIKGLSGGDKVKYVLLSRGQQSVPHSMTKHAHTVLTSYCIRVNYITAGMHKFRVPDRLSD